MISQLAKLERDKSLIGERIDQEEYKESYVSEFALKLFSKADNEDRLGQASKFLEN